MRRKYQHEVCGYCKRAFTVEEVAARKAERRLNMERARQRAKENGTPLGRKKIGNPEQIRKLKALGHSLRGIARKSGVSTTVVQRILKDID